MDRKDRCPCGLSAGRRRVRTGHVPAGAGYVHKTGIRTRTCTFVCGGGERWVGGAGGGVAGGPTPRWTCPWGGAEDVGRCPRTEGRSVDLHGHVQSVVWKRGEERNAKKRRNGEEKEGPVHLFKGIPCHCPKGGSNSTWNVKFEWCHGWCNAYRIGVRWSRCWQQHRP